MLSSREGGRKERGGRIPKESVRKAGKCPFGHHKLPKYAVKCVFTHGFTHSDIYSLKWPTAKTFMHGLCLLYQFVQQHVPLSGQAQSCAVGRRVSDADSETEGPPERRTVEENRRERRGR